MNFEYLLSLNFWLAAASEKVQVAKGVCMPICLLPQMDDTIRKMVQYHGVAWGHVRLEPNNAELCRM